MSVTTPQEPQKSLHTRFKKLRHKYVKRLGKKITRNLAVFLSQQSLIEDTPFIDMKPFPELKKFEENWRQIREELEEILKFRDEVPAFQEVSPDQKRITTGKDWRTFVLYGFQTKMEKNCSQAPITTQLLEQVPNLQTAWFSILAPNAHIPAHQGVTKGIVRCHLGLIIPEDAEKCRLRVHDEFRIWHEGEAFLFDDSYEHEVWNETDEERVILLFDFDRPMKFWGRMLNKMFIALMKFTAYYQEPKKNMQTFEERFAAVTRRADANMEKLGK